MKVHLLLEGRLGPIPAGIQTLHRWNNVEIFVNPSKFIDGDSVILEGSEESFVKWLKPFDHVWLGEGSPMLERFVVGHIK